MSTEDLSTQSRESLEQRVVELEHRNQALEQRFFELYTLYSVGEELSLALQLDELFTITLDLIVRSLGVEHFFLALLEPGSDRLMVQVYHGLDEERLAKLEFQRGEGFVGQVVETGQLDVAGPEAFDAEHPLREYADAGPLLAAPLSTDEGPPVGVLVAHKSGEGPFSSYELKLFEKVGSQVGRAIRKAQRHQETAERALRDPLTGLYNRRYLFERLEKEVERGRRYGRRLSLLLVEVDHFLRYTEAQGHEAGGAALRCIAGVLQQTLRKHDMIARFGTTELVILLPETSPAQAQAVAEKLRHLVANTEISGQEVLPPGRFTATIGQATFPEDAPEALTLISEADQALELGRSRGRDVVVRASEVAESRGSRL